MVRLEPLVYRQIVRFARLHGVTQIFLSRDKPSRIRASFAAAHVQRIVSLAGDMQVAVVADITLCGARTRRIT